MGGGKRNAKNRSSEKNMKQQQQQSSLSSTTTPITSQQQKQQQQLAGRKVRDKERGNESTGHPHHGSNSSSTPTKTRTRGGESGALMSLNIDCCCWHIVATKWYIVVSYIVTFDYLYIKKHFR